MDHKALMALGAEIVGGRYILNGKVVAQHTNGHVVLTEDGLGLKPKVEKAPKPEKPKAEKVKVGETVAGEYVPADVSSNE